MKISNSNKLPVGGALAGDRYRVIVSTDIGGTDDLARDAAEEHLGVHTVTGAKSVSRWREDYLRDFAERMDRCKGR